MKIPDAFTLIHTNKYQIDKKSLEKKIGGVKKKIHDITGLVTTAVLNKKIVGLRIKFLMILK